MRVQAPSGLQRSLYASHQLAVFLECGDGRVIGFDGIGALEQEARLAGLDHAQVVEAVAGRDGKTPSHAQLGVSGTTVNSQIAQRYNLSVSSGAYVTSVSSGTSAANAGIQVGDIITKCGDTTISSSTDLVLAVRSHNVGDTVSVTCNRNGQESTVQVTLGSDS